MDKVLLTQGIYYIITGLWPIIHIKSFEKLTGPKTDKWLVNTVGLILINSGVLFLHESRNSDESIVLLAILNAISLTLIDLVYVIKKIIRRIYLLDAGIEIIYIFLYLSYW